MATSIRRQRKQIRIAYGTAKVFAIYPLPRKYPKNGICFVDSPRCAGGELMPTNAKTRVNELTAHELFNFRTKRFSGKHYTRAN
jgi:hypothetical protein